MFNFIDLFAGIGGMRLGVEMALKKANVAGACVFTSEYDKYAVETYEHYFRDDREIFGDITKLVTEAQIDAMIPDHQILLAGFPCQPFSIAGVSKKKSLGRAHGFEDPTQGTLFFNLKEIIRVKRPDAFLLENVKNLVSHDGGETYRIIMAALQTELGYQVHTMILDGQAFVPQHRERIYFIGFREPRRFDRIVLRGRRPTLGSILKSKVDHRYTLSPQLWAYLQAYAAKHRAKGNGFGCSVVGPNDVARTLSARYYKDGSEILVRQPGGTPRRLTPEECALLMGFPRRFRLPATISDTRAYKQFGNSVVVPVIRVIACRMLRALQAPVDPSAPSVQIPVRGPQMCMPLSA